MKITGEIPSELGQIATLEFLELGKWINALIQFRENILSLRLIQKMLECMKY